MNTLVRITCTKAPLQNSAKTLIAKINVQAVRTITSKLEDLPPKPKPWNYKQKKFNFLGYLYDKTSARFDENTKLIVVEGPVAAGKSKFAREIAKSFGMLYLPEANLDMKYINNYGYDLRKLDSLLPPDCRSFDVMDFLKNPKHKLVAKLQIEQYLVKLSQYIDALAHVFSTGQGVVLDRCVYSDFIFLEAMYSQKYISKPAYRKYYEIRESSIQELLRPHLIIYLDVPIPKLMENIKKRDISYEKASPVLSPMYLEVMERNYKQNYLKDMSQHAELLVYDWEVEGDMEVVLEDIEAIDFEKYDFQDSQMKDWVYDAEEDWAVLRHKYTERKDDILTLCNVSCYDVPELLIDALDAQSYYRTLEQAPGQKYEQGYNSDMGDRGLLFKWALPERSTLPLRERRKL